MWILLLFMVKFVISTDQVFVHSFEAVLLDYHKQWIVELTYEFNDQNTTEDARKVVMEAIDKNWKPVLLTPACARAGITDKFLMNPIEKVKYNSEVFINYREALKTYIDKLLEIAVQRNVFNSSDDEKIREMFWEADLRDQSRFTFMKNYFSEKLTQSYSENVTIVIEQISVELVANDNFMNTHLN